jgi:DNA polymerase-3 subunit delta
LEFLKSKQENIIGNQDWVAIFWEDNAPKKNNALYKFLEKNSKKQHFEKLSGIKINQWTLGKLKELNLAAEISKGALEKLIIYSGGETITLNQEIQKLFNYAFPNIISESDVENLVKAKIDSNIFETIGALSSGNKKQALNLLHKHLAKDEDPFYLFSMFVYQFRNLLKIADLKENGLTSEYDIARIAKLHPFVVKKSLPQINRFGFFRLKNIYNQLGEIDTKIKTGQIEIRLALDKFVAEI